MEMSDDDFAAALGVEETPSEQVVEQGDEQVVESSPSPIFLRDFDEETAYTALQHAKNFPEKLSAFRDQAFGKMGNLERQFKEMQSALSQQNTQASVDPSVIRAALEKYDKSLAESGLAEAIAQAIKVSPIDENVLSPFLSPYKEEMNRELVLSHYDVDDLNAIVPPVDSTGNLTPQTQRHKDFLEWYELQPLATQNALENFGPRYVTALRKFEKWEAGKHQDKVTQSAGKVQRLASGQQPSAGRRAGNNGGPQTAQEAFLAAWNEED
jgi:hypothetical protein